jgi:ABC-2 type transport system ATP-binding protein
MAKASVVEIKDLVKTYKSGLEALKGVSLTIHAGEIFALLGPNGAGKTTLINIIAGLTKRTSGEVLVLGKDVDRDYRFTRSKIGVVQQEISLEIGLKIFDSVRLQAGYYGLRDGATRAEKILQELSLWDKRNQQAFALSGGMKRRVMIAKAMVHDPDILFLDEPTAGVDLELRENLWRMVNHLRDHGKTIILTTHYLEEAESMADRIGIINDGRLVALDAKESLMQSHAGNNLNQVYAEILEKDRQQTL